MYFEVIFICFVIGICTKINTYEIFSFFHAFFGVFLFQNSKSIQSHREGIFTGPVDIGCAYMYICNFFVLNCMLLFY